MQDLTLSLVQADLIWENPAANREKFETLFTNIPEQSRLIILPEMFSTGFSMQAEALAETESGKTRQWLSEKSVQLNKALCTSLIIQENARYYNRLYFVKPNGSIRHYDKRHLFRMAGEDRIYSAGSSLLTTSLDDWKIRPLICYDLRFPVWSRNTGLEFDLLIYIANWPERRILHWQQSLIARAIENQCYVVGVNRTGIDGTGIHYTGSSMAVDPLGRVLAQAGANEEVLTVRLNAEMMLDYRQKFPAWQDADRFTVL